MASKQKVAGSNPAVSRKCVLCPMTWHSLCSSEVLKYCLRVFYCVFHILLCMIGWLGQYFCLPSQTVLLAERKIVCPLCILLAETITCCSPCIVVFYWLRLSHVLLLQIMNEQLPLLIQGFRGSETNQDSATAQLQLINASKEFIQV